MGLPMNTCHILRMLLDGLECLSIANISLRVDPDNHRQATLTTSSDDDAREIAKGFGAVLREVGADDMVWLSVLVDLDGVALILTGPTRKGVRLEVVS